MSEEQNRPDLHIKECEYCGKLDCNYDCDESQAGGFNSAAAAPRVNTFPTVKETTVAVDNAKQQLWYNAGKRAKQRGYGDFSPFYENATADYFFKCGYDNVPFVEAQQVLKEKIEQILDAEPEVKEVLNELQPQKS